MSHKCMHLVVIVARIETQEVEGVGEASFHIGFEMMSVVVDLPVA